MRFDLSSVAGVFEVYDHTARGQAAVQSAEYVVLFDDGSHFCSCVLLQSRGFVCCHVFNCMQDDGRFLYHINLIPERWNREDVPRLHVLQSKEVLVSASTTTAAASMALDGADSRKKRVHGSNSAADRFFSPPKVAPPTVQQKTKKSRYAKLIGAAKGLVDNVTLPGFSEQDFNHVVGIIEGATSSLLPSRPLQDHKEAELHQKETDQQVDQDDKRGRDLFKGIPKEMIADGQRAATKGRPKTRRLKASFEPTKNRQAKNSTTTPMVRTRRGRPHLEKNTHKDSAPCLVERSGRDRPLAQETATTKVPAPTRRTTRSSVLHN